MNKNEIIEIIKQLEEYIKAEEIRQAKIGSTDPVYTPVDESIFECTDEELEYYKSICRDKNENQTP